MARAMLSEQLTNASIDCVLAMDNDGRIIYWNDTCFHYSGLAFRDIEGQLFAEIFPKARHYTALTNGLAHVKLGVRSFVPAEKDAWLSGYFDIHLVPLKNESGSVMGILLIAHDVAHRIKAEQELRNLNQELQKKYAELERANAELATFTRITSNDLKEPLRKIYSSLEKAVMEEGAALSPKGRNSIRKVQSSIQRLGLLADSLTTFSELQQGMMEPVSLDAVLADAIRKLQTQAREHGALITIVPLPEVSGDKHQLQLLFVQLLSNAIKFHKPEEQPHVRISVAKIYPGDGLPATYQGALWRINITDNGIGVQPEDRDRIFDLFTKGHTGERFPGAGVGLALARKIVTNHSGYITVAEAPGGGSIFSCFLPAG